MTLEELRLVRKVMLSRFVNENEVDLAAFIVNREIKLRTMNPQKGGEEDETDNTKVGRESERDSGLSQKEIEGESKSQDS